MARYWSLGVFEALLVYARWTLLDRGAGPLIDRARADGAAIVNAAIFGGPDGFGSVTAAVPRYGYRPARPAVATAMRAMAAACARHGTDLHTAALHASIGDPRVTTTVVGASRPGRVSQILAALGVPLPSGLADELAALLPDPGAWIDAR